MSNIISTAVSKTLNVVLAQGSAIFTNSTNNIALTGIGRDVEVGDVIQISGAANAKNNSEFTVEVITDDSNVIVNQPHAGGTTSKSLVSETAEVTVKLLCKWYLASESLGRGLVEMPLPASGNPQENNTGRGVLIYARAASSSTLNLNVDTVNLLGAVTLNNIASTLTMIIPAGSQYNLTYTGVINSYTQIR
jgi:hypothetical protein